VIATLLSTIPAAFVSHLRSCPLHATLEVDQDAAADPVPEGHLDRRFSEALAALLGKDAAGLSPTAIGRLKADWVGEHDASQKRDLSAKRYVYALGGPHLCKPGSKTRSNVFSC
jgi:hypothetical protein